MKRKEIGKQVLSAAKPVVPHAAKSALAQPNVTKCAGIYLFNSDLLFSDERTRVLAGEVQDQQKVAPLVLRCINVQYVGRGNFMGSDTWRFQVLGHGDNWYRTHYDWALIEDTPENVMKAKTFHAFHEERAALQCKATKVFKTITTVKVPQ